MSKKSNELKILSYGNITKLKENMDPHFLNQLNCVANEMTQEPKTINELNSYINNGKFTHVIIPDENFNNLEGSLKECHVPVIELLGDHWVPWAIDRKKRYIQENEIDDVFVFTNRFLEDYSGISRFHYILSGFDSNTFFNKNEERDIDILVSGSLGEDTHPWVYPVRNWLARVLPEIGKEEGLKIETFEHPGYTSLDGEKTKEYAEIINRAKIATGGSSHWRLVLKKLYEIPACGTILLSDIPLDDTSFFKGRIIDVNPGRINEKGYKDELRRTIMNTLKNYDDLKTELQPFRTEEDYFNRSYQGRALEMRTIISSIN